MAEFFNAEISDVGGSKEIEISYSSRDTSTGRSLSLDFQKRDPHKHIRFDFYSRDSRGGFPVSHTFCGRFVLTDYGRPIPPANVSLHS
jgi:hypothetical protein